MGWWKEDQVDVRNTRPGRMRAEVGPEKDWREGGEGGENDPKTRGQKGSGAGGIRGLMGKREETETVDGYSPTGSC